MITTLRKQAVKTEHITPSEFRQKMGIDHPESNKRTR